MSEFKDMIAVVTGGGTGMGRELVVQLAGEGCHVAMCDVSEANMAETAALCADSGVRVTSHICDVSDEDQVNAFRDGVVEQLVDPGFLVQADHLVRHLVGRTDEEPVPDQVVEIETQIVVAFGHRPLAPSVISLVFRREEGFAEPHRFLARPGDENLAARRELVREKACRSRRVPSGRPRSVG